MPNWTSKYMKQKWIKLKKVDKSTIPVGNFKMSLTATDRTTGDKISKIWKNWTPSTNRIWFTSAEHCTRQEENTHLFHTHGTFTNIGILGHKTNLNKLKGIEIIQNIFSDHYRIKLEMSSKKAWRENGHICEELIKQQ